LFASIVTTSTSVSNTSGCVQYNLLMARILSSHPSAGNDGNVPNPGGLAGTE
jgi:hypothetical protein